MNFKRVMETNDKTYRAVINVIYKKGGEPDESKQIFVGPYRSKSALKGQVNREVNHYKSSFDEAYRANLYAKGYRVVEVESIQYQETTGWTNDGPLLKV